MLIEFTFGSSGWGSDQPLAVLLASQIRSFPAPFSPGSGRLEMAQAIASPDNPLTARVIVNRIWKRYMGTGIVEPADDWTVFADRVYTSDGDVPQTAARGPAIPTPATGVSAYPPAPPARS